MTILKFSQFLSEAPLPDEWDHAIFSDKIPFARRVAYAKERATRLGSGSSRIAFVIPYQGRDTVLKIAKNRKGMAQNEVEIEMFSDWYAKDLGIFIPMIDYDESSGTPTWLHTELAGKVTDNDFIKSCGGTLSELLRWSEQYTGKIQPSSTRYDKALDEKIDENSDLASGFGDYVGNYDANIADYSTLHNWGLWQGQPVIIDAGYNNEIAKLYRR